MKIKSTPFFPFFLSFFNLSKYQLQKRKKNPISFFLPSFPFLSFSAAQNL